MQELGRFLAQLAQRNGASWLSFMAGFSLLACGNHAGNSSGVQERQLNLCPGTTAPPEGSTLCRGTCDVGQECVIEPPPTPALFCRPISTECTLDSDCGDAGDQICV